MSITKIKKRAELKKKKKKNLMSLGKTKPYFGTIFFSAKVKLERGVKSLHSGPVFQQKLHTVLLAITSSIVERGVLILIQSIHLGSSLQKNLRTLNLEWGKGNSIG